jgi:hypothetical protein
VSDHHRRPPLRLRPRRSRWLALLVLSTHLLAGVVLLLIPLEFLPRLMLLLLVAISFGYGVWAQVLLLAPWSLREATWSEQGWQLRFHDGRQCEAVLLPSTLVSVPLVILLFRVGWLRYPQLILTKEVIDAELMRRLRVRLRLQRSAA